MASFGSTPTSMRSPSPWRRNTRPRRIPRGTRLRSCGEGSRPPSHDELVAVRAKRSATASAPDRLLLARYHGALRLVEVSAVDAELALSFVLWPGDALLSSGTRETAGAGFAHSTVTRSIH